MINFSDYSCGKCAREFSRHCKHCYHTAEKPPTKFKKKKENKGDDKMNINGICTYSTPCGWCAKWDKKCDKKIGGGNDIEPRREKDMTLEYIKSGKGLPPLNTNSVHGLEMRG